LLACTKCATHKAARGASVKKSCFNFAKIQSLAGWIFIKVNSMNPIVKGFFCALCATALWSGNFIVSRALAHAIPPVQLNFWRWMLAFCCILPFMLPHWPQDKILLMRHWKYLSLMALLGISLLNTLVYKAGQSTEGLNMALLFPTAPMIIMLFSRILYKEPITPRRLLGLLLVVAGVLAVISRGEWQRLAAVHFAAGDFWTLAGALAFGLYSLLLRQKPQELSMAGFNGITFVLGAAFTLPALALEMYTLPAPTWDSSVLIGIAYTGIGCSFAAYWLWTSAIAAMGPVRTGFVYYCMPLFAAIAAVIVLRETITFAHLAGAAGIIGGIVVATLPPALPKLKKGVQAQ
jgi:drug/metabolite transporter (DMT)-like permease